MVAVIKKGATKDELKAFDKGLKEGMPPRKKFDAHKFCGTVKFEGDGLEIQKRLRDEWR